MNLKKIKPLVWPSKFRMLYLPSNKGYKIMKKEEILESLESLKKMLNKMLVEGEAKGKEVSVAYECGIYIGTIKATINELENILGK